ncbi:MAG: alpha/beta hydrolase [Proteobacteria bacterium]|nr:alpha/beta hydrolase [Pseudomonadota bacterium]
MTSNDSWTHRIEDVGSARIHWVEAGSGPVVLMVHGFPESWYSWRNQIPALAEAGYRAVAIDVRGYGRSSKPTRVDDYRMVRNVADIVGLAGALGSDDITLVGHDWGAPIVWSSALLRPDLFRGVAGLSVPYSPPGGSTRPTEGMRAMAGDDAEFYIEYFQKPGRAEAEIEADVRQWLLGFYWCASGSIRNGPNISIVPRGSRLRDQFQYPEKMPDWLNEDELDNYVREFEYSGFFGPLSRYRNVDRDWADLAAFSGQPIRIPSMFVGGDRDGPTIWGAAAIERFSDTLPELTRTEILSDCGHWTQQECAQETNALLIEFLDAIH